MSYNTELQSNNAELQAILNAVNALPEAGEGAAPILQSKTVTPSASAQAVTPDDGYDGLSDVTVNAIPSEYIVPAGAKSIAENGSHDVREFASVDVSVDTEPVLQEKTVTPAATAQMVQPDIGYDGLSKVTVNAMPTVTQATPSISVSSEGLITASATQSAGYVAAGTKSATKQLTTQAAQTITPGTSDKTIASGRYLTGTQIIKGDANLVAGNIKSGVSIFGVAGSYEGSGSGDDGGSIETCTFTITSNAFGMDGFSIDYLVSVYKDGSVETIMDYTESDISIDNVVAGSCVSFVLPVGTGYPTISSYTKATNMNAYLSVDSSEARVLVGAIDRSVKSASIAFDNPE